VLMSPLRALSFECLDLERSLLVCRKAYILGISMLCSYIKVIEYCQEIENIICGLGCWGGRRAIPRTRGRDQAPKVP